MEPPVLAGCIRLAVYLVPPSVHPLYRIGAGILCWDLWQEREVPPPEALRPLGDDLRTWVGAAHIYGLHATIGDALDYAIDDLPALETELVAIAARRAPFTLTGGRIHLGFRSGTRAVVATFDSQDRAVNELEEQVVTRINVRHRASPNFGPDLDDHTGLAREHLQQFGSPMVRSMFDLHFSLATSVPNEESRQRLVRIIENDLGLFTRPEHTTLQVDRIHLLTPRPDGRYRILATYPLTG